MEKKLYTITVFSENMPGILNQITIVFTRRQLNIETLSVSPSALKGIHKFTITVETTLDIVRKVVTQIDKRIDVIKAYYNTDDELVVQEIALYKVATDKVLELGGIEQLIRKHNIRILELTPTCIVFEKTGMYEETQHLFEELQNSIGVLQFIRSGRVAITKSKVERLSDMLASIEECIKQQKTVKVNSKVKDSLCTTN